MTLKSRISIKLIQGRIINNNENGVFIMISNKVIMVNMH